MGFRRGRITGMKHAVWLIGLAVGAATASARPERESESITRDGRPPTPGILHHEIAAWITPETAGLEIWDTFEIDGHELRSPDQPFRFLLHGQLRIASVIVGNRDVRWQESDGFNPKHFWARPDYAVMAEYAHAREIMIPPTDGGWRDPTRITIRYAGAVDDTLHPPEEDYGRSFETTTGLIEARGAYLAGGTFWLPTVPEDLFTFTLTANLPARWDAVSEGALTDRYLSQDRRVTTWTCTEPMEEAHLVAGPYLLRRQRHGDVSICTYTYERDDELTSRYLKATRDYLDRYEAWVGPYPFPKFALVENFWQTGYGMPSFTLLGSIVIRLPFIVHTSYGHEILHNWFGNAIFVDLDTGNWCEGLTVYLADYAYKEEEGAEAAADYRRNQLAAYLNYVSEEKEIPLSAFHQRHSGATQAIGYGKSMMVFHMLRQRLGQDLFRQAIRDFYQAFRFKTASWEDLIGTFADAAGQNLDWFTEQWIRRSGAPLISLGDTYLKSTESGFELVAVIQQEEPTFRVDVPVEIEVADGTVQHRTIECARTTNPFQVPLAARPTRITVDPGFDVFRRLHRAEIPPVLSQTLGADSTVIILAETGPADLQDAYRSLAEKWGNEPGMEIVHESDVDLDQLANVAVWLFGDTRFAKAFAASGPEGADLAGILAELTGRAEFPPPTHTIVDTRTHPANPDLSWTWLRLADAKAAEAIGRKIPHYGKYSYLVFEGANNVGKGTWRALSSPLTAKLD